MDLKRFIHQINSVPTVCSILDTENKTSALLSRMRLPALICDLGMGINDGKTALMSYVVILVSRVGFILSIQAGWL